MNKLFFPLVLAFGVFMIPAYGQVGDNTNLSLAWHEADDEEYGRGSVSYTHLRAHET